MRKKRRITALKIAPYRSRYEFDIAKNLTRRKVKFDYEDQSFQYHQAIRNGKCLACDSVDVAGSHIYTPDFILRSSGNIIEAKGRFVAADRTKILTVLDSELNTITRDNFRMLFMQDRKLSPKAKLRYGSWCDKYDIEWDIGPEVPETWL